MRGGAGLDVASSCNITWHVIMYIMANPTTRVIRRARLYYKRMISKKENNAGGIWITPDIPIFVSFLQKSGNPHIYPKTEDFLTS